MKVVSFRALALASLTLLAMATSGNAITILQYTQANQGTPTIPADQIIGVQSGGTTTLTTRNGLTGATAVPIPILITRLGTTSFLGAPLAANLSLQNVVSQGDATVVNNEVSQTYSGTIVINNTAGTLNFLTIAFTNAVLSGTAGGGLKGADVPGQTVDITSGDPLVIPVLAANTLHDFGLGFSGITPALFIVNPGTTDATIGNFAAVHVGTADVNPIPEPSGIVMAGTAMIASLSCFAWRRRRSSRA